MKYSLLIADDEQMERDALRFIINRESGRIGEVYDAANGREAVARATEVMPDIVLLDIKMPGINGVDAAARILEQRPETRVVFLTAYNYFDYAQQAIRLGVADFIVKPATDERVLEVINRVVADLDAERQSGASHTITEQRLQQARCALEESLVLSLVRGEPESTHLDDQSDALDLRESRAVAFALQFDFSSYPMRVETDAQRLVLRRRCIGELKTGLAAYYDRFLCAHQGETAHMLAVLPDVTGTCPTPDHAVLEHTLNTIHDTVAIRCVLGADLVPRTIDAAGQGMQNAVLARGAARQQNHPVVVAGPDSLEMMRFEDASVATSRDTLERELVAAINRGEKAEAVGIGRRWLPDIISSHTSARAVRRRVTELMVILAHEFEIDPEEITTGNHPVMDRIEAAADTAELEHALSDGIGAVYDAVAGAERAEPVNRQVEEARLYIEREFRRHLTLEDVAAQVRLSPYYFSRAFKSHTGSSFVDYLNSQRVARARKLLRQSALTVKEIAHEVGYADPNYFSRVFKQHTHLTPTAYRSKNVLH